MTDYWSCNVIRRATEGILKRDRLDTGCLQAQERTLNISYWSQYYKAEYCPVFKEQKGQLVEEADSNREKRFVPSIPWSRRRNVIPSPPVGWAAAEGWWCTLFLSLTLSQGISESMTIHDQPRCNGNILRGTRGMHYSLSLNKWCS